MKIKNMEKRLNWKKCISIGILCTFLTGVLAGCGNASQKTGKEPDTERAEQTARMEETEVVGENEAEKQEEETDTTSVQGESGQKEGTDDGTIRTELTATELAKLMGNGINLGNTMEAFGRESYGTSKEATSYETFWGQPVTTREMIEGMKAAGFDSIRIPIAWTNVMDYEDGDYTIKETYLNRINELIDYARGCDMYVIINDHWDGSWWGMFGSETPETREKAMEMYVSMWKQIAERYQDYSDYLIFESANEELGDRLNDIDVCDDSGSLSKNKCYETANLINQTFVDTIRASGGNNEQRFLLIAGYNTDIAHTCDSRFVMPKDTAKDKLLVSVHYYTPWSYCGTSSGENWGTKGDYEEQNRLLGDMKKFTDQGYGVIIGEYAVLKNSDGSLKNNTCDFINNFLDNCDIYGYCPMLWDCSDFFLRKELKMMDEELAKLYLERSFSAQSALAEEDVVKAAQDRMADCLANAPEKFEMQVDLDELGCAMAWIMFSSKDWNCTYSAGDVYDPTSKTAGLEAVDAEITEAGTYTVSLDFTKTGEGAAKGIGFAALAVGNGELLFPGYTIEITELLINGEPYELTAKPYTTSDDGKCTRVNLYNEWVSGVPSGARSADGDVSDAAAIVVKEEELGAIETIEITFAYMPQ